MPDPAWRHWQALGLGERQRPTHSCRRRLTKTVSLLTKAVFDRTLSFHTCNAGEEFVIIRDVLRIA